MVPRTTVWLFTLLASGTSATLLNSVVDAVVEAGGFKTLVAALDRAALTATLRGAGPFTVLAPTDAAFEALAASLGVETAALLDRPDLAEILAMHVLGARVESRELVGGGRLQMLQGAQIAVRVQGSAVSVGGAPLVAPDVLCSNGVIHAVGAVLLPPERLVLAGGSRPWDASSWRTVLDGVMGGRSSGSFRVEGPTLVFSGVVNNEGGGFASIRKTFSRLDLSSHAGVWIEMEAASFRPDKAPLGISIQLRDSTSSFSYAAPLAVPVAPGPGSRVRAFLPMSSFDRASRSGWRCAYCTLNPAAVVAVEVYVLFQSGPFEVRLAEISVAKEAWHAPALPPALPVPALSEGGAVSSFVQAAIRSGGYVYDKGYQGLCGAIYASAALSVLKSAGVSASTRGIMCAAHRRWQDAADDAEGAWALRRAFDAALADERSSARAPNTQYPSAVRGAWLPSAGSEAEAALRQCSYVDAYALPAGVAGAAPRATGSAGVAGGTTTPAASSARGPAGPGGLALWLGAGMACLAVVRTSCHGPH